MIKLDGLRANYTLSPVGWYFSVQLVEKLGGGGGGGGGAEPPQSEKWEGLSPPCPPYISAPGSCHRKHCFPPASTEESPSGRNSSKQRPLALLYLHPFSRNCSRSLSNDPETSAKFWPTPTCTEKTLLNGIFPW